MRVIRPLLLAVLLLSLAAYAVDCSGMQTQAAAMHCCASMPCSHGGKPMDCCRIMPSTHLPFVQSASVHNVELPVSMAYALPAASHSTVPDRTSLVIGTQSHAPPGSSPPSFSPLRI